MGEMTDFRIMGMIDPEESDSIDAVTAFACEQGMVIVKCRFSVNGERAAAMIPIPRGLIDDSEFDLDAHCREISQNWAERL